MILNLKEPIEINTFGFNIPSREFVISAQITRDKRMPLVDEFILRALNIAETVSLARLAKFFSFEGTDLGIALADLQARSLVTIAGENISLHPSAKTLFKNVADKSAPTIGLVEEFHASVWFDLISQGLVRRGAYNARNLLSLRPSRADMDLGADFARAAFDSNFHDFLRRIRGTRGADQWSLYSILDVQPGRYGFAQLTGHEVLHLTAVPKVEPILLPDDEGRAPNMRALLAAMADEFQKVSGPPPSAAARDEYGRLIGNDSLRQAMGEGGYFDLPAWLASQNHAENSTTQPIIGAPYLQRNLRTLLAVIAEAHRPAGASVSQIEIHWLRPGGTAWGISEDLNAFLSELRAALRQKLGPVEISTTLLIPSSVPPKIASSFDRIFDRGIQLPPSSLPAGLELLAIHGVATVACAMVPLSSQANVSVGTVTADAFLGRRIDERAKLTEVVHAGTQLWKRERSQSKLKNAIAAAASP